MRDMFSEAEIRSWRDFVLAKFGDWFPLAFHFGAPFAFAGLAGEGGAVRTLEALGAAAMLAQDEVPAALGVWHLTVVTTQRVVLWDDDGVWDLAVATVLHDRLCELTGVVLGPVQGTVPTALDGDQGAVGAGHEA